MQAYSLQSRSSSRARRPAEKELAQRPSPVSSTAISSCNRVSLRQSGRVWQRNGPAWRPRRTRAGPGEAGAGSCAGSGRGAGREREAGGRAARAVGGRAAVSSCQPRATRAGGAPCGRSGGRVAAAVRVWGICAGAPCCSGHPGTLRWGRMPRVLHHPESWLSPQQAGGQPAAHARDGGRPAGRTPGPEGRRGAVPPPAEWRAGRHRASASGWRPWPPSEARPRGHRRAGPGPCRRPSRRQRGPRRVRGRLPAGDAPASVCALDFNLRAARARPPCALPGAPGRGGAARGTAGCSAAPRVGGPAWPLGGRRPRPPGDDAGRGAGHGSLPVPLGALPSSRAAPTCSQDGGACRSAHTARAESPRPGGRQQGTAHVRSSEQSLSRAWRPSLRRQHVSRLSPRLPV
jgi:hypothetical protein